MTDLLAASINPAVIAIVGIVLAWLGKGRFDALDRRIDRMEERLDGWIDGLRSSMDALRSDLTQVALAVGIRPRAQND
jgi:hypothetical protein